MLKRRIALSLSLIATLAVAQIAGCGPDEEKEKKKLVKAKKPKIAPKTKRAAPAAVSREEARRHLQALHRPHDAEAISDIQVSKVEPIHEPGTTPGHYQQP